MMRISNSIISKSFSSQISVLSIIVCSLFIFLLVPLTYAQDDPMEAAIKSIWPDKQIEVIKKKDGSFGDVVLQNYGALVEDGEYEYHVIVNVVPKNAPSHLFDALNMQPIESKQYEVDGVPAPVWITNARDSVYYDMNFNKRANTYINQETHFKCGDIYVITSVIKDSGTTTANPSAAQQWTQKFLPLSKEFAQKTKSAVCSGGGCNVSQIYDFYKKYLGAETSSFSPFGVRFSDKFNENYKNGYNEAFGGYPSKCPRQTKEAMLNLIRSGFDAPDMMWRITASKNSFQEERGTPREYGNFIKNLSGPLGNTDPLVRRFVHYPRKLELQINVGKKMDKPMKDILMHVVSGQIKKISEKITEHSIDAASWVLLDENNASLFDADKFKYYVNLFNFTNSSLSSDAKGHEVLLDYIDLSGKNSGKKRVEVGVELIKEAMFFIPELIKLYEIQLEYNFVSQSFDQLQTSFPDVRNSYEKSLLRLNLIRHAMRDGIATVKRLEEKNKKYNSVFDWPEEDRKTLYDLTHAWIRNWSLLDQLTEAHGILLEELKVKKDEFVLTWYLLGYPDDSLPPMEVIY